MVKVKALFSWLRVPRWFKVLRLNIRARLLISFFLPIICIIILGVFSYNLARNEITRVTKQTSQEIIKGETSYFNLIQNMVKSQGYQLMSDKNVMAYINSSQDNLDPKEWFNLDTAVKALFNNLAVNQQYVRDYTVVGMYDRFTSSNRAKINNIDELKGISIISPVLSGTQNYIWCGDPSVIDQIYDRKDKTEKSLIYVASMKDINTNQVVGLVIIEINPAVIEGMLTRMSASQGINHIISQDGFDNGIQAGSSLESGFIFSGGEAFKTFEENVQDLQIYEEKDTMRLFGSAANQAIILCMEIPRSVLDAGANRIMLVSLIIVLISVSLSVFIGMLISGKLSASINRIVAVAKAAAKGDLRQILSSKDEDELGILLNSIGSMMESMRKLIREAAGISDRVYASAAEVNVSSQIAVRVSGDISVAMGEIASGATLQANDAESAVRKTADLADGIGIVSENTEEISKVSQSALQLTKNGLESMMELDEKNCRTNGIVNEMQSDINKLSEKSNKITGVIKIIKNMADQTQLLALNASIEAARAGAAGRGFSVVADEVGKLADQTALSVQDIVMIIRGSQADTNMAVSKAMETKAILNEQNLALKKSIESYNKISESMENLAQRFGVIHTHTDSMTTHKDNVLMSIQNISAVAQETAATTEEVTASSDQQATGMKTLQMKAESLEQEAQRLKEAIKVFLID